MRRVLTALLLAAACTQVDPDDGRFACATAADCGEGFECRAQHAGGRLCFREGECAAAEACNGRDDTCDGRADEGFDLSRDALHCGACNQPCAAGTACAASACVEARCDDGTDDDGDGLVDCQDDSCFRLACAPPDGGRCGAFDGGLPDAGPLRGCFAPEASCADGRDDDGDGLADCLDPDCDGRVCASGTQCTRFTCPGPG